MDDIKIFVQNEKELETLKQNIRIYSQNRIWHWKMCHADNKKWGWGKEITEGIELLKSKKNQNTWNLEKENDKDSGI